MVKEQQLEFYPWPVSKNVHDMYPDKFVHDTHPDKTVHDIFPPKLVHDMCTAYLQPQPDLIASPTQRVIGLQDVIQALTGLQEQVKKLSDQVKELQQRTP